MFKDINDLLERIPIWKELVALPKKVQELELKIKELESKLAKPKGVKCPYCNRTETKLTQIKPHLLMPEFKETRLYKCESCNQTFERDSSKSE